MVSLTTTDIKYWFPEVRPDPPPQTFEIGLVLAGAVSAGAYTAGVVDFLFEALDAWYRKKHAERDLPLEQKTVPDHNVLLRIITGASAGGMNGAIAAAALRYDFPHVRLGTDPETADRNPFYKAWIDIDLRNMLETTDIVRGQLHSFLNCRPLDRIAKEIISYGRDTPPAERQMRNWVCNPLPILLTVTNLKGVPYCVNFRSTASRLRHEMTLHRDYMTFAVPDLSELEADRLPPDITVLEHPNSAADQSWWYLAQAALATGAFPMFLAPRRLSRNGNDYDLRNVFLTTQDPGYFLNPPAWRNGLIPNPYDFVCVDGGVIDNEPFELARVALAGTRAYNERNGDEANRAVIMVDPFCEPSQLSVDPKSVLDVARQLASAVKDQVRFKPLDLALAQAKDIYSRFLIAPTRGQKTGNICLASGGLGGFLGFLCEEYRRYDFLLGRRNCQRFLQTGFTLPAGNGIFKNCWSKAADRHHRNPDNPQQRQIIPLIDACAVEETRPPWPGGKFKRDAKFDRAVEARLDAVYTIVRDTLIEADGSPRKGVFASLGHAVARAYFWPAWRCKVRPMILNRTRRAIDEAVKRVDQQPV